ncbi:MAG: T9SS type B sorting domain-containing protein [Flavobacteriaceae bacterium]
MQIKDNYLNQTPILYLVLIGVLSPFFSHAQLSKQHYIPPVPDLIFESAHLYISTPHENVQFTIKPIGQPSSNWVVGTLSNTNSFKIEVETNRIGASPWNYSSDHVFANKGFEVFANREVYVSLRLRVNNHAGSLVSKGIDGLGKSFRVGGMERQGEEDYSFFSLMATKNNTIVNLSFDPALRTFISQNELPQTIVLDKNETYIAVFNGIHNDLFIGTHIESQNNDIVVNSGSILGSFSNEIIDSPDFFEGTDYGYADGQGEKDLGYLNGSDMGIDQMISLNPSVDATEYLLIKGDGFNSIENALIIANEDNTLVYLNDNNTPITLDAGEHVFVEGTEFTNNSSTVIDYLHIQSNKNIYVFQGTGKEGTAERWNSEGVRVHYYGANQGMFFVPPLSCTSVGDVESIGRINEVDNNSSFSGSLFVLSSYGSSVKLNEDDISSLNNVVFEPGPIQTSTADYQIHRVDDLMGDVSIVGSEELYVSYYNFNNTATSGAFYSGFNLEPKIYPNLSLNTLGNCVDSSGQSNVVLQLPNAENYDSLKWQKQKADGSWENIFTGSSDSSEYTPNSFGSYRLEVVIDCLSPNSIVYSSTVNVSICPNDSDKDGVVDNIDLDNDNDGVYDKIESLGDFEIDLTTNPPALVVDNPLPYSTPALSQVLSVGNGTFTPFNDGRFTSFLPPKQSSNDAIRFELNPVVPKSLHFSFGYDNNQNPPAEENTYYTIESIDPSESITLLDPDSDIEILIEDDYVGGFMQYNSSKITFRFSSTAAGSPPSFQFFSTQSSGLVFTHQNDSSVDSVFEGHIRVINLDSFSDSDNLADAFDLDSDDDGCFDVIEAGFLDPDNDGRLQQAPLTIDDNTVNDNGLVIGHNYDSLPNDFDSNAVYDFQELANPAEISPNGNPVSVQVCEGEVATFSVDTPTADAIFQWVIDGAPIVDNATFSGTNTNSLTVTTDYGLNGAEVQVLISRPTYACPVESIGGVVLTVSQIPDAPTLEPIYTYCNSDVPTIEDLKNDIGGSVSMFLSSSGGSALPDDTLLVHDQTYYVEAYSSDDCVSLTRAETDAFISNPELFSSETEICEGESVTLTVNGVPQTAQDFAIANPDFERFLQYESSSYFLKRESMAWTEAYNLIQSLGAGASMYVINSKDEEDAVYDALNSLGVAGTPEIHFWLGLRQLSSLNPNNEIDEGWQWLDGRILTDELANWTSGEPNDCCNTNEEGGEEDYGQFDFNAIKTWNDMRDNSQGNGDSWPVFEFTGTTDVVWGKINPSTGTDIVFNGVETSSINESPTETTTYFYEVTTNGVTCRVETTIVVNPLPVMLPASDMEFCDNDLDGDAFNGLINDFDLQAQELSILNGDSSLEVLFFINETDTSAIDKSVLFGNSSNPQQLYYRLKNKTTGCESNQTDSFMLRVQPVPPNIEIEPHYECDDQASGSDIDDITTFDLQLNDSRIQTLLGGTASQYSISYHTTLSDAEDPSTVGITSYTMTVADNRKKTIYIRVTDNLTSLSCFTTTNRFDLVLTPLPVIDQPVITFEQCDETDGNSDGIVLTNLRSFENLISTNSSNEEFTYYTSSTRSPGSKINDPASYYNIDINGNPIPNDVVYVQINSILPNDVFAPNGSCALDAEIRINVAVSQIKDSFMLDFDACEIPPSTTQDGRTLFPPTIFDTLTTALLNEHPLFRMTGVVIQYYPTLEDAALKTNEIDQNTDYENPNPVPNGANWVDEIWANVEVVGLNTITCIGLKKVANLHIERLPTAHAVAPFRACDDDDDGLFVFDTTRAYQELTKGQTNIQVSYFDTNYNFLFTGAFPNSYQSGSQKIIARVENDPSINTPSCYEETEIEFIVDDTPNFNPIPIQELCDDSDGVIDGMATFDTQFIERDILNGQTDVAVYYFDDQGNALPSPLPSLFSTSSTSIRVELVNTINTSCVSMGSVDFNVFENPSFDLDQQGVLCLDETVLDLEVKNPSDNYSYVWEYIDENNAITRVGTSSEITIDVGGTYTVTATSIGDIGCSTTKSIEVITSEFAKFDTNDIIISGFSSQENTVEIIIDNLGVGDYEYALDDSSFQDDPYFEQVRPGMRTVKVRDKNGCGVSSAQVGVVGYYKYFSPNNDGINDTWQILGLKTTFNSNSLVYIYDRYGRFLYQLSNADDFWDGTYQGQPLPADDYWFRLELEDGRIYSGHFSLMR